MSDLISRQALETRKFSEKETRGYDFGSAYREGWNDAIDAIIDNEPSAQPEQRWIPCSERLPEDDTLMLVNYIDERPDAMDVWIGWHEMENVWYIDGAAHSREFGNEVVAWMPLPDPYKEGEKDE